MTKHRYVVEVLCTGQGFAESNYGADTLQRAQTEERLLRAKDSAWVNPKAPKQTRVRDNEHGTTYTLPW